MRNLFFYFASTVFSALVSEEHQLLENQIKTDEYTTLSYETQYERGNTDGFLGSFDICNMSSTSLKDGQSISIHSPRYPNNYDGGRSCTRTITSEQILVLTFHDMELEKSSSSGKCYDYISVDNVKFCGNSFVSLLSSEQN